MRGLFVLGATVIQNGGINLVHVLQRRIPLVETAYRHKISMRALRDIKNGAEAPL
jgi:hypothetical protein